MNTIVIAGMSRFLISLCFMRDLVAFDLAHLAFGHLAPAPARAGSREHGGRDPVFHQCVILSASQLLYTSRVLAKLRFVLICMIVLAMPVQGIAAATMRFCAPAQHAQVQHAAGAHSGIITTDARRRPAAPSPWRAGGRRRRATTHRRTARATTSKMKCSVCAVCCMAAALAPRRPDGACRRTRSSKVTLPAVRQLRRPVADGLERPPRTLLA